MTVLAPESPPIERETAAKAGLATRAYASTSAKAALTPFSIDRRQPGPHDVLIDILYCGVCHSDIHQARGEWGGAIFPMVPGHEIVGIVAKIGEDVQRWRIGEIVGVGNFIDSCSECDACLAGAEQFCQLGPSFTYNSRERDGHTPTYGGYLTRITVDEKYILRLPETLPLAAAAPLLCAGITTYSPLRHFGVKEGYSVAVVGLGGLGHLGVKFAKAFGAHVTVLSHSPAHLDDALRLGADEFIVIREPGAFEKHEGQFQLILDTVSARHDYNAYLTLLRHSGTMVLVGVPDAAPLGAASLITGRRRLSGSMIGSIRETQQMLDFCGRHGIAADVEVIAIQQINEAYERVTTNDVRYRFVIDMASLRH
jgi:uncharacterized zinc-type alcohol dehydrogenase-like protein